MSKRRITFHSWKILNGRKLKQGKAYGFKNIFVYALLCGIFYFIGIGSAKDKKLPHKYSSAEIRNIAMTALNKSKDDLEGMSDYVFGEVEKFIVYDMKTNEITAKYRNSFVPSFRKEYVWFLRDGFFVRSPTLVDGVSVAPAIKTAAEETWLNKEKENDKRESFYDYLVEWELDIFQAIMKKPPQHWVKTKGDISEGDGNFAYIGEKVFEGHNTIEIQYVPHVGYLYPGSGFYVLSIIPEEHQIIKFQVIGTQRLLLFGKFENIVEMIMAKQDDKIWLPKMLSYQHFEYSKKRHYYYTREFHSFKKTHVETNIEFNDVESDSNPLREDVKSKTQFDMKTPVPPKKETPPSKKDH